MASVRGGGDGFAVVLYEDVDSERIVMRGVNGGGFSCIDIDLLNVLTWSGSKTKGHIDADSVFSA